MGGGPIASILIALALIAFTATRELAIAVPAMAAVWSLVKRDVFAAYIGLGFAGAVLGTVCAILRRSTAGVLAPAITHVIWGAVMVLALPSVFA